jgi:isoaspartyl peptidase/L-asparaginase-like protein (Ntn-hydrolase superfamily)
VSYQLLSNPIGSSTDIDDGAWATDALVLDNSGTEASYVEGEGVLERPISAAPAVKKHMDRVAVIIEDRPLGNLIPVICE